MTDCIFCKIVAGQAPCHKVWEDECHLAFLSIFPNTPGFTVVVTKEHAPSYVFQLEPERLNALVLAARTVALKIDRALPDVGRTGLIAEGFGVDHAHVKLVPMHGTANMAEWKRLHAKVETFFTQYPGYLSSHDSERGNDQELAELAKRIAAG